jgi:hypothetical protein
MPAGKLRCIFIAVASAAALQDVALWHKLAEMSLDNGFIRQAIYCYNKVRTLRL